MDKNSIIGFVLIGLILVGFSVYTANTDKAVEPAKTEVSDKKADQLTEAKPLTQAAIDTTVKDSAKEAWINEGLKKDFGLFYNSIKGEDKEIVVENDKMKMTFSPKGGYISKVELKDYRSFHGTAPLNLFIKDSSYYQINFNHVGKKLNTRDFYFVPSAQSFNVKGEENKSLSFKLVAVDNPAKYIEFLYIISGNDYKIDFKVNIAGLERDISGGDKGLTFEWEQYTPNQEKIISEERKVATMFYYNTEDEQDDDYITEGLSDATEELEFNTKWVSMKQQFFSSAIIAEKDFEKGGKVSCYFKEEDTTYVKRLRAELPVPMASAGLTNNNYSFYFGPNDFDLLDSFDVHLQDQVNLGWGIFGLVNEYFMYPLVQLFDSWQIAAGMIIILLTLVIKMVLFPITYKNYLSSAKMRVIKPELDKLNEANKNADPLKKQQATMELYKKTGVNPMAGCIPALLQMPILYALFRLFPTLMELRQEPFLWAEDLSAYDSIYDFGFEVPLYGDHISLFTILMAVSLFFYTRFTQQMTPSASATGGGEMQQAIQKQMKIMMNIMPVLMLFFFNNVASGLTFYYFLANVITIGQTIVIKKYFVNEEAILAKIEEHKKKPMTKSRFQKKLEELQNQGRK
ncbi:MAG: membrane protein insertase YidC [Bacteroidetes bacterium]|nr:membrane protein insertase YidC [Bacteroidota bacterium]